MSTLYDLYETPDVQKTGEKQPLHPRIVAKGTIGQDEFLDRVSKFTGLSRSMLSGAMESFYNELRDLLADGWNVELGNIGFFSSSLQCPPVMDKKEIRAGSVSLKNINFRAGSQLKKEVRHRMRLERSESLSRPKGKGLPEKEVIARLNRFLEQNPCINCTQYCALTGHPRYRATKELNAFIEKGILVRFGLGKSTVYAKPKEKIDLIF